MSRMRMAFASVGVCFLLASPALGQYWVRSAPGYQLAERAVPYVAAAEERTAPSPSDQAIRPTPAPAPQPPSTPDWKDGGDAAMSNCCGRAFGWDLCHEGEPWELFPESRCGVKVGGWFQAGYNDKTDGKFNSHPGRVHLHQGYLYAEKVADGQCGWDWGFRTDLVYGVDGQDTQAFGNNAGRWDFVNGFDHGIYGWALPQAYAQVAYHDLSVKIGHFYTLEGYESVMAPSNFFYSHAFTMYNSEPFTHTGILGSYQASDKLTVHGGWTLGWDTGFDQYAQGNNFLGGLAYSLTDNVTVTYMTCIGNLGWRGEGYSHSLLFDFRLTEKLNYVLENDWVETDGWYTVAGAFFPDERDDIGINQYLFYELNDCWKLGGRFEWWKRDGSSLYEATAGVNWKPLPNFVLRPEVRYNWGDGLVNNFDPDLPSGWIFGIDGIITF